MDFHEIHLLSFNYLSSSDTFADGRTIICRLLVGIKRGQIVASPCAGLGGRYQEGRHRKVTLKQCYEIAFAETKM